MKHHDCAMCHERIEGKPEWAVLWVDDIKHREDAIVLSFGLIYRPICKRCGEQLSNEREICAANSIIGLTDQTPVVMDECFKTAVEKAFREENEK